MVPAPVTPPESHHTLTLSWVLRMRWGVFAGLLALLAVVAWLAPGVVTSWPAVAVLLGLEAVSNQAFALAVRRGVRTSSWLVALVLGTDLLILTGLLVLTGGAQNPFAVLYVVHVAVAAVVLPLPATVGLTGLAALLYAGLFLLAGDDHTHHAATMTLHLRGMWFAYVLSAALIVGFVGRLARALREQTEALHQARLATERAERLAALGTLASGAAHELNTPLSTISVIAAELQGALTAQHAPPAVLDDLGLLLDEVGRCHQVLQRLSADAGATLGEVPRAVPLSQLVERATALLAPAEGQLAVDITDDEAVYGPVEGFAQALRALVQNALDATAEHGGTVTVRAFRDGDRARLEVRDTGPGIPADVLDRLGEPFVTTKGGMGLGVFLARSLFDRFGVQLHFANTDGATTVTLAFPAAAAA